MFSRQSYIDESLMHSEGIVDLAFSPHIFALKVLLFFKDMAHMDKSKGQMTAFPLGSGYIDNATRHIYTNDQCCKNLLSKLEFIL